MSTTHAMSGAKPAGKQLRVLSGLHAGASLQLEAGSYRLMSDAHAQATPAPGELPWQALTFLDWSGDAARLELRPDSATAGANPVHAFLADAANGNRPWDDFDPRRVGGLVLCLGNADALWPADAQLIARLAATGDGGAAPAPAQAAPPAPAPARMVGNPPAPRARHAAAGLGVGLLLAVSTLFGGPGQPRAPQLQPVRVSATDLERTLHDYGLAGLTVQQDDNGLLVTGLLDDAAQDALAQRVLAPLRGPAVRVQWSTAEELAATIDAALRAPRVRTRHLGQGRFIVEGQVDSPERLQAAAEQLRRDVGPALRELTVNVTAIRRTAQVSSAVAAGGLRYDERRDGTKRFGME